MNTIMVQQYTYVHALVQLYSFVPELYFWLSCLENFCYTHRLKLWPPSVRKDQSCLIQTSNWKIIRFLWVIQLKKHQPTCCHCKQPLSLLLQSPRDQDHDRNHNQSICDTSGTMLKQQLLLFFVPKQLSQFIQDDSKVIVYVINKKKVNK